MPDNSVNFGDLDKIIHEPARLQIMAVLSACTEADFKFLEAQTGLTPGNLSSHLAKLEKAEYVRIRKVFKGKIPSTTVNLTPKGSSKFKNYLKILRESLNEL